MVDGDDPFKTQDATVIRPRPGAGKRGVSDPLGARPTMMPMPAAAPLSGGGTGRPGDRAQSAGAGGQPAAPAGRARAQRSVVARHPRPSPAGARRHPLVRGSGARGRRPQRDRPGGAVRAVRDGGRSGHVDARRLAERVGTEPPAGGTASGGLGRREVLRDAGPHRARPGPAHRPDGTPVRVSRPGFHGQVPHDGPRSRAAGGRARRPLSHDPQPAGQAPDRARPCDGAASRIGATGWCGTSPGGSPQSAWSPS